MADNLYAVIATGGKQYKVTSGSRIIVEKINAEKGSEVTLNTVMMSGAVDGTDVKVGAPYITGAKVTAKVLAHDLSKKTITFKKIRRTGYQKKQGHRQQVTHLEIQSVSV
ncbi:MAG: 50S ribosomal protein L21 [bacterium]|nr:50S ribosomal protein L21 [bacterium]